MSTREYRKGSGADILVYADQRGESPVDRFIAGLGEADRRKIVKLIEIFAERGEIRNEERFIHEEGHIYSLKVFKIRIFCFFLPDANPKTLVLTHGCKKKKNKGSRSELEKAERIRTDVLRNISN